MEIIERKTKFHHTFPKDMLSSEWPTPPTSFRMPFQCLMVSKRGGGKTASAYFLLKQLKKQNNLNRLFIISPTAKSRSNEALWRDLEVDPADVFEDAHVSSLSTVLQAIDDEAEEYREYLKLKTAWDALHKIMKRKNFDPERDLDELDEDTLQLVLQHEELFDDEPPRWKYMVKGQPQMPMPTLFCDDLQGAPIMYSPLLTNLIVKNRHHGYSGVNTIFTVQSYSAAVSGCPKVLRLNCTILGVWKTHDEKTLEHIMTEASEVPKDDFVKMYMYATSIKFRPFVIEFTPKEDWMRYRAGWDKFIELKTYGQISKVAQIPVKKISSQ